MIDVVVVDDERLARERIKQLLKHCEGFKCVGEAENGEQAIQLAKSMLPEIILMDIRMPVLSGIEAAMQINQLEPAPAIIFCTAFNDYAVQAFDSNAVGYLLKPVSLTKLQATLDKASKLSNQQLNSIAISHQPSLQIKSANRWFTLAVEDICYCQAEHKYVVVYYWQDNTLQESIISESLSELESRFSQLLRVHRNALVNRQKVIGLEKKAGQYHIKLKQIEIGPIVSRRLVSEIKNIISG